MGLQFENKVVVVTGGASGIGLATVERFVEEGARVVVADLDEQVGQELEQRFLGSVLFVPCNVMHLEQLKHAVDMAVGHFGRLDVMINNAGSSGSRAGVMDFDAQGWDDTQALLLRSVAAGTSFAAQHMKATGGAIVNTASISAFQAGAAPLAYSTAKAGVVQYTKVAAAELSAYGIRVNAVAPGFVATRIFGDAFGLNREEAQKLAEQALTRNRVPNPLGITGRPIDIAQAILFLASDAACYMTGTCLTIDGGTTIGPRHSWDPNEPTPLIEAFGLNNEQAQAANK